MSMARICVVDDERILRESLAATLERDDHTVCLFDNGAAALAAVRKHPCDLVLTDLKMPGMDGIALIRELRDSGLDVPVVMMTAFATIDTAVEAIRFGAFDYVQKPFQAEKILVTVDRALENARLQRDNEALRTSLADFRVDRVLVGEGASIRRLREQMQRVAMSHDTVLITGESGTGKELVASYIHRASPRGQRPMLCLNCAALSSGLLESELFGHERGAFTGADRVRKGRFEIADGGTLLLDEISEMELPLQAKLLRVLQEGEFERVGSSVTKRADVRVIATSNRDLDKWVSTKKFRADLYYRLNVLPVVLSPLRDRIEDIPVLVEHFLAQAATRSATARHRIDPAAMRLLEGYRWPGNVRELENICRRAVTLCNGDTISAKLLQPWLDVVPDESDPFGSLRDGRMLEDMERQLIERTLVRFQGHRAKSAKALGMGVRTLGLKLKQWREEASMQQDRTATAAYVRAS